MALNEQAVKEYSIECTLYLLKDFDKSMDFIVTLTEMEPENLPDLIFINTAIGLNKGVVLLDKIKTHKKLSTIPVIMIHEDENRHQVDESYFHNANALIPAPADSRRYINSLKFTLHYWMSINRLINFKQIRINKRK
jgi:two-component SAPR family response regulator